MDAFFEYFERNFKLAYKSVTFHFKNYIWFYIAIFLVQTVLGIVGISMQTNSFNAKKTIEERYNSHYAFYYMNTNQVYYLKNAAKYTFKSEHLFDIKEIKEYYDETDKNYKADVYIKFAGDARDDLERFNNKYLKGLESHGKVYSSQTPLFDLESRLSQDGLIYRVYILAVSVCALILFTFLYNIRANNFRFDYGIYMTFGADKKRLLNTSYWEMTVIAILTFVPSVIFSWLITYILSVVNNTAFHINIFGLLGILVLVVGLNVLAVTYSLVKTSVKTPVSLIVSIDNSNMVHSPRMSSELFSKKPLNRITLLSFRRYLKYYSGLIFTSVLFCALFVCIVFCGNLYAQKNSRQLPKFEITYSSKSKYTEDDRHDILAFSGVTGIYKEESTSVMALDEHILVNKSNTKLFANRVNFDDNYVAMDNVSYYAADDEVVEYLKQLDYTGDLSSVLNDDNTIIISDSFNNTTHFDFKVGDKIKLADYYTKIAEPDMYATGKNLLKERLYYYIFKYEEVTVGAVIHNDVADDNLKIYMSNSLYTRKTDKIPEYKTVYVYTDNNLTHLQQNALYEKMLGYFGLKYNNEENTSDVFIDNLYASLDYEIESQKLFDKKIISISCFVLICSGIFWIFSQTLFYSKRTNEFNVLRAIGFTDGKIKKMFYKDALIISGLSLVVYFAMTYLFTFIIYKFFNSWIFLYSFRYMYKISYTALLVGAIMTVLLAFISTMMCYGIYKKRSKIIVPEQE